MSKIGKKLIIIPKGVKIELVENAGQQKIKVFGPKGELEQEAGFGIRVKFEGEEENKLTVIRLSNSKKAKAMHGLIRTLIANMIQGVEKGWNKGLELHGVGYKAEIKDQDLVLQVGFSHPATVKGVEGIEFEVKGNLINVKGIDKQKVGEVAARIREIRKPEPYKGKGIRYVGEQVRRKLGKAAKTAGA